ncbi:hypothetical protein AXG93_684s1150 [Marchantia polymorpha subsp. ruderalis]|uniref:Uncharacterized protein n=1 Tax=Marchantia polymorpha subsp. ruderalis TaxID=1480154 RepID=A0A176W9P9_MARPO|nr:hypothetical protein AXG93_684s1150 [Marchantia polymorpha subsp. ruderalis]
MAADAIHDAKDVCDIPKLGVCNDFLVASYARVACAILIEHISQALSSKWAFFVAFDASNDLHQTSWVDIDIVMQKVYKLAGCDFHKTLTSIISFLRRQKNLAEKIEILSHVSECVKGLQGFRVTLQQQTTAVQSLLNSLQRFAFIEVIPDDTMPHAHDVVVMEEKQVSHADLTGFIQDQSIFASQTLAELQPEECTNVLQAVGEILLSIVNGLSSVEALRDEVNDASTDGIPPCLPHELLALKTRDVFQLVLKYHDRLSTSWSQSSIY